MTTAPNKVVNTEYGPVKGVTATTLLGRDFYNFRTVPFMRSPIGRLRFRDPQAPEKWTEAFDATTARPSYTTLNFFDGSVAGREDAGILSVSTPYLDRNLPVAVYIHGGGFKGAYGEFDMYGPDYLLQKDMVIVRINYRVGPMGFLSLNDPELGIPGNAGLKDQVFALKWVRRNIANFGGDPNNVTVFGTSAGASSVHFLMMSDKAKGLFHRALPMSGTSFIKGWTNAPKKDLTERLAALLGWDGTGGEKKILEVLENAEASDIVIAEGKLLTKEEIFQEHILFPFTPVVEPYVNEHTFLPKDPVLMGREAWGNDIDCMISGASAEGSLMGLVLDGYLDYYKTPETFAPVKELGLDLSKPADKAKAVLIGEKMKKNYFGDNWPTAETINNLIDFSGDAHFWHGIYRGVLSRVKSNGTGKTFFYRFDCKTSLNFGEMFFNIKYRGAGHGDDLPYFLASDIPGMPTGSFALNSKEFQLIKKMTSYISSFIIDGKPSSSDDDFEWEPISPSAPLNCLNFSNTGSEMVTLPEAERLKLWDEILEDGNIQLY